MSSARLEIERLKLLLAKARASSTATPPSAAPSSSSSSSCSLPSSRRPWPRRRRRPRSRHPSGTAAIRRAAPASRPAGPLPEHLPRERIVYPAPLRLPQVRRPGPQAGRGRHRDARVRAAALEGGRARAGEGQLPLLRGDQPAAGPSHPIARGPAPGPNLLALVLAAKYGQHLPLTRQSAIYAREGVELDVSTLADWVGSSTASLMPLVLAVRAHVFAAERLHGDDTTVPVLAKERTKIGRCGAMSGTTGRSAGPIRRRWRSSTRPTAAASIPSGTWPGSPASCRRTPMPGSTGSTSRTASRGRSSRPRAGRTRDASCSSWPRSAKAPIAAEAVRRIDELFKIEREINGKLGRAAPGGPGGAGEAVGGRARGLAACPARAGLAQGGDRQGDRLRPQPLGRRSPGSSRTGGSA